MFYINFKKSSDRTTRREDLKMLGREYNGADKRGKKEIRNAAKKINSETSEVRSMRQSLLREHRAGNTDNVKDIHEYTKNKAKYK